jgi:DnaK suppressor protein
MKRVLDRALVEEFRGRLLEVRSGLLRTIAVTDDELATLEGHQPGAPIEDAAREEVLGTLSRLGHRERHELEEIYAAGARLDAGTFGVCEDCRKPLPLDRLRAMPIARYCVPCQQGREGR